MNEPNPYVAPSCQEDVHQTAETLQCEATDQKIRAPRHILAEAELVVARQRIDDLEQEALASADMLEGAKWLVERQKKELRLLLILLSLESFALMLLAVWLVAR